MTDEQIRELMAFVVVVARNEVADTMRFSPRPDAQAQVEQEARLMKALGYGHNGTQK